MRTQKNTAPKQGETKKVKRSRKVTATVYMHNPFAFLAYGLPMTMWEDSFFVIDNIDDPQVVRRMVADLSKDRPTGFAVQISTEELPKAWEDSLRGLEYERIGGTWCFKQADDGKRSFCVWVVRRKGDEPMVTEWRVKNILAEGAVEALRNKIAVNHEVRFVYSDLGTKLARALGLRKVNDRATGLPCARYRASDADKPSRSRTGEGDGE